MTQASYAYLGGSLAHRMDLPVGGPLGLSWGTDLTGQLAFNPLPDTERLALGGMQAARAYQIEDASVDTGAVWRNELRFAGIQLSPGLGDRLSPYVFADLAAGTDIFSGRSTTLASAGIGLDYNVGRYLSASLAAGWALLDAQRTRAGDFALHARLTARF